jgi:acyl carrier protein
MANQQWTADEIRKEVKKLVAEITEREPEEVSDAASFIEDLGIDSLMAIEMLVAVDKKYKIEISEEEFGKIKNVNDAVELVQRHLAQTAPKVN